MKDEEIAEEWVSSAEYQRDRPIEPFCADECSNDWAELAKYAEHMLPKAFLAGLKAGRPQWHDLLKDPNDLPENKRKVWCDYGDGYGKGFYDKDDGSWLIEGHMYCSIINAWCEIPTFDKE